MSSLHLCTALWGSADVYEEPPSIEVIRNGFYLPYSMDQSWGVFFGDGRLIQKSVDFRDGTHLPVGQTLTTQTTAKSITDTAPDDVYIYGGFINPHFGHFLINTLPRFWAMTKIRSPNTKILCHGPGTPQQWFAVPHIGRIFGLLGLFPSDFIKFDAPVRLRRVVVPATSLEEQLAGYRSYAQMCNEIGSRIRATNKSEYSNRPVYYSKTRLTSAVGKIVNESEIEEVLRRENVDIIYPETLSFDAQVRLMSSRKYIIGSSGSYFHASIFCPGRRISCISVAEQINSNYVIIDCLANNTASYYYPPEMQVIGQQDGILTARYLPNAARVIEDILEKIHS